MRNSMGLKSIFGFGFILLIIAFSAYYFAADKERYAAKSLHQRSVSEMQDDDTRPKFSFDDVFGSNFSYKSFSPRWISGNQYIYSDPGRNVYLRDVTSNTSGILLMDGNVYTDNSASAYKVSSTQEYILLLTNYVKGWRHSYNGSYLIYDVANKQLLDESVLPDNIQYVTWSTKGNALAYVKGFDIYYRNSPEEADIQITDDGRANHIYNGIPDWVYEEEMISSNNVMYFSPDGSKLAFAQFNDTDCDHIEFIRYDKQQYPVLVDVSYPKAGATHQPKNKVFIYDILTRNKSEILPPISLADNDYLFNRVVWGNATRAVVLWCDRAQTRSVPRMCDYVEDMEEWNCFERQHYEHKVEGGWLYQRRPYWIPVFGVNADEFFTVLPNGGWQHLARKDSENEEFLTEGEYTVTSESASYPAIYHYDKDNDYVYFLATIEDPGKRQIYRVKGRDQGSDYVQCVSCPFANQFRDRCNFVTGSFSNDGSHLVLRCRGEGAPLYALFRVNGSATEVEDVLVFIETLENNTDLVEKINSTQMSSVRHDKFPSATTNYDFHYEMWLPPDFSETNGKTYPLLIDVYAGPGYQNVDYLWTRSWAPRYVPVGLDAIVVRVDGRGSNFQGDDFMHAVYKKLGQFEIEDQIEAARHFASLPYIDGSRIAIWGWSYGGFATSHAVGLGTDVIKCGMAVAPLTDWRLYDTIYAERYMGLPTENGEGYDKATVMNKAANFNKSNYLLIHGMTDDNVHFQNAALLEKALVEADVSFKTFFYADQDHSIGVGNARKHIYKVLTKELCSCFGIPVPNDVW